MERLEMHGWRRKFAMVMLLALAAGLGVGAGLLGWGWYRNWPVTVADVRLSPQEGVGIGTPVVAEAVLEMPWYRLPLKLFRLLAPPESIEILSDHRMRLAGIGLGKWRWACGVRLQAFELGKIKLGELEILCSSDRYGQAEPLRKALPELTVVSRLEGESTGLKVAQPYDKDELLGMNRVWLWTGLGALGVLALILLVVWWAGRRKFQGPPPAPPWETALRDLQAVEGALPMPPEACYVKLTDIIRAYLEQRFDLQAGNQTTPEFLVALQSSDKLMAGTELKLMLADFLSRADMIKFAREEATQQQLAEAVGGARRFVVETRPSPEAASDAKSSADSATTGEATR
jgi:hypothetical protein